jgi:hypothetical protein
MLDGIRVVLHCGLEIASGHRRISLVLFLKRLKKSNMNVN